MRVGAGGDFVNGKHKREMMRESVRPASESGSYKSRKCADMGQRRWTPTKRKLETVFGYYLFGFLVDQE